MKNSLGIIGGVGPLSSAYFYEKIIKKTKANCDQDHINIILLNHATIPDRTAFILGKSKDNPLYDFIDDVKMLNKLKVKLIVIPCNTAGYFHDKLTKYSRVPIIDMIDETVRSLKKKDIKTVGIMATDGTIQSKLYQNVCDKYHINSIIPSDDIQKTVTKIIYENVKKGKITSNEEFMSVSNYLFHCGAEVIILGCTELSVLMDELHLDSHYTDPLDVVVDIIMKNFEKEENGVEL